MASDLRNQADVVVIGGGVIGASSAWWLERLGADVLVLERRPQLGTLTTPNALGTIRTQFGTPELIELATESLAFYQNIETHLGVSHEHLGFSNPGYLYLSANPDHYLRLAESLADYEALGVRSSELLDKDEIARRFSFAGDAVAAIFHGHGSFVNPTLITDAWVNACVTTEFATETGVEGLDAIDGGWIVHTNRGDVRAAQVVVAAGPYTPALLAPLGINLPVKVTPRYKAFIPFEDPDHASAPLVINIANGAYWRPVPGGVWLSHANVDDRSMDPTEKVTVPEDFLAEAVDQIAPVSPQLADAARTADPNSIRLMGGYQVYPKDDAPIIGPVGGFENLLVNTGHWAGVMLSPASGRLLADLVMGKVFEADNICSLGRFDSGMAENLSTNKFGGWG